MADSFDSPDGRTYSGPPAAAAPGQAGGAAELERESAARKLEFDNWFGSQGYDDEGRFDSDEMEFAFEAGREAAAAQEPRAADGTAGARGLAAATRPRVDWARVSEAVADRERERDEARADRDRLHNALFVIGKMIPAVGGASADECRKISEVIWAVFHQRDVQAAPDGRTYGQRAYEARREAWETRVGLTQPDWDELHADEHGDEEAGAQAVLNGAFPGLREQVRLARERCDDLERRFRALAARLDESAAATEPSRKSEIEHEIAIAIRQALED